MTYFWAKTTSEGEPGISVYEHMVNVGCVARCIAEMCPALLELYHLRQEEVGALAALHDLGKISPGFQRKCEKWLEENGLLKIALNGCWDTAMESDHGAVSHSAIQDFLTRQGIDLDLVQHLSTLLAAHHGRMKFRPNPRGIRPPAIGQIAETGSGIDWYDERGRNAQDVWSYFDADARQLSFSTENPAIWWLGGLTSVADWIGSDERFFPAAGTSEDSDPAELALNALEAIGLRKPRIVPHLSFHDLFHDPEKPEIEWCPNEMQESALSTVTGPGVYVIEAPMGMGKTEAALWAAYHILLSGKATGIYFALPTQATSNRIHLRMNEFVRRILQDASSARLIHGNSWLFESDSPIRPVKTAKLERHADDARAARDWFASTKRALIAPFGVGTIDQALLGVVAAKHFFVRHFALAGKVVILDEIHSYDLYTGTLVDKLITVLEGLGCTVIVLSATLTGKRRAKIVSPSDDTSEDERLPYPLITGRREGVSLPATAASQPLSQDIKVDFVTLEKAETDAIALALKGGAVLWISNTVGTAQEQYQRLVQRIGKEFPVGLLHSRFPFRRREELENIWMERLGKNGKTRCGCILVSTQVVEQSVDLDADLLITELAPTDMLLQRLGRLWRHQRERRPSDAPWLYILEETIDLHAFRIMAPESIEKALGSKARVYAPFVLLRSLELWKEQRTISIPAQIRQLIEATYRGRESEPDSWQKLADDWFGRDVARKMRAARNCNLWQVALEDEEGVQTRIDEVPTCALTLCRSLSDCEAEFIDGARASFGSDEYRLSVAQAIHRNLVRVPDYCFDSIKPCSTFGDYLHGKQCAGIVTESGAVEVKGLKRGVRLSYSDDLGLVIDNKSK